MMADLSDKPAWAELIREGPDWEFRGSALVHRDARTDLVADGGQGGLKRFVVNHVYASHKRSRAVQKAIGALLDDFEDGHWGLNFGAGATRFHDRILNLDIGSSSETDIVSAGQELPFRDESLHLVLSQEVLEHVDDPLHWIGEIHRVLHPGGRFYCQMPFIIGYHPGPSDFWRFTKEAYPKMFSSDCWDIEQLGLSLGHGSAFYRILVEFLAVTASVLHPRLYTPTKGLSAILFAPLQLFDALTRFSSQKDRIPGGYFCIARKK